MGRMLIDLNSYPDNVLQNDDVYEISDDVLHGYGSDTVVFTGETTLSLLPSGKRRGQAPIPFKVKRHERPDWLPLGWWIDYRVRQGSTALRLNMYKYYVDPVSGKKFRSRREVEEYLHPEIVLERVNPRAAANPNVNNINTEPRLGQLTWGRKRKQSSLGGDSSLA